MPLGVLPVRRVAICVLFAGVEYQHLIHVLAQHVIAVAVDIRIRDQVHQGSGNVNESSALIGLAGIDENSHGRGNVHGLGGLYLKIGCHGALLVLEYVGIDGNGHGGWRYAAVRGNVQTGGVARYGERRVLAAGIDDRQALRGDIAVAEVAAKNQILLGSGHLVRFGSARQPEEPSLRCRKCRTLRIHRSRARCCRRSSLEASAYCEPSNCRNRQFAWWERGEFRAAESGSKCICEPNRWLWCPC